MRVAAVAMARTGRIEGQTALDGRDGLTAEDVPVADPMMASGTKVADLLDIMEGLPDHGGLTGRTAWQEC